MTNTKDIIEEKAVQVFLKYGFRSVTMDDLSKELSISKKTLYRYFTNKEDLLKESIRSFQQMKQSQSEELQNTAKDPIEMIFLVIKSHLDKSRINFVSNFLDLKKYYHDIWEEVVSCNENFVRKKILKNIEKGIELGLYRPEINKEIIAHLFYHKSIFISDPNNHVLKNFSSVVIIKELVTYHLNGICTTKGRTLLNNYLHTYFNA